MTNFTAENGDKNGGPGHSLWALLQICLAQLANCDTLWWSWSWLCYRYSLSRPSKHHKWSQRELWKYSGWIADISNSKANLVKTSPWQASNPHHRNWISILESYIHCNILTYSISRECKHLMVGFWRNLNADQTTLHYYCRSFPENFKMECLVELQVWTLLVLSTEIVFILSTFGH